jgi:hypothetical protein
MYFKHYMPAVGQTLFFVVCPAAEQPNYWPATVLAVPSGASLQMRDFDESAT